MPRYPVSAVVAYIGAILHADGVNRLASGRPSAPFLLADARARRHGKNLDGSDRRETVVPSDQADIEAAVRREMARPDDGSAS